MVNSLSLEGKRIFITGGTRGIGRAISLRFAAAGASVVANYVRDVRSAEQLMHDAGAEGFQLELCRADLTSPKGLERTAEFIEKAGSRFDSLVHCAATGVHKPIGELSTRHFEWTFSLNVLAFMHVFKLMLPHFAPESSVVVLSSMGAAVAVPNYALVGSSKAAVECLARSMAAEYGPQGIRVNILRPGAVLTDAWKIIPDAEHRLASERQNTPLRRLVTVEEVACAAQFLCSRASAGIVGHTLVIDGGRSIVG
jgi:NAD(P)-dependent dehydrogenase (short-subunit alcohol dehydrogenase family)